MATQRQLTRDLRVARRQAEEAHENIDRVKRLLAVVREELQRAVGTYTQKRVELFEQRLVQYKKTWCTKCGQVVSADDVKLLLTEGSEEYTHGYGGAYYGFRNFLHFYRACSECCQQAFDRHGRTGAYDSHAKGQSSFYAFIVEKREDAYYARKFGKLVKCAEITHEFSGVPDKLIEQFAVEWALPPRIEINSIYPNHKDELVIHEQIPEEAEATAVA